MEREILGLDFQTTGTNQVDAARQKLDDLEKQAKALDAAFAKGALTEEQYKAQVKELGTVAQAAALQIQQASQAVHTVDAAMNMAQRSPRNFGMAVMEGSRALEDLQYGIAGTINQVPGLVTALGGGMGLAGVVSVVTVGAYQLYRHWNDLADLFGLGHTKSESERMEDLANKTNRTAAETEALNKHKREQARIEQMLSAQSKSEKETEQAVGEAITEAGPNAVQAAIAQITTPSREMAGKGDPVLQAMLDEKKRLQDLFAQEGANQFDTAERRQVLGPAIKEVEEQITAKMAEIAKQRMDEAGKLMDAAKTKPGKFAELQAMAQARPELFPEGFGGELSKTTPQARRQLFEARLQGEDFPLEMLPQQDQDAERKVRATKAAAEAKREAAKAAADAKREAAEEKRRAKALGDAEQDQEKEAGRLAKHDADERLRQDKHVAGEQLGAEEKAAAEKQAKLTKHFRSQISPAMKAQLASMSPDQREAFLRRSVGAMVPNAELRDNTVLDLMADFEGPGGVAMAGASQMPEGEAGPARRWRPRTNQERIDAARAGKGGKIKWHPRTNAERLAALEEGAGGGFESIPLMAPPAFAPSPPVAGMEGVDRSLTERVVRALEGSVEASRDLRERLDRGVPIQLP